MNWHPFWLLLLIPVGTLLFFLVTSQPLGLSIAAACIALFLTAFAVRATGGPGREPALEPAPPAPEPAEEPDELSPS